MCEEAISVAYFYRAAALIKYAIETARDPASRL